MSGQQKWVQLDCLTQKRTNISEMMCSVTYLLCFAHAGLHVGGRLKDWDSTPVAISTPVNEHSRVGWGRIYCALQYTVDPSHVRNPKGWQISRAGIPISWKYQGGLPAPDQNHREDDRSMYLLYGFTDPQYMRVSNSPNKLYAFQNDSVCHCISTPEVPPAPPKVPPLAPPLEALAPAPVPPAPDSVPKEVPDN